MYRLLLVPLDGSVFAEHALATAAAIAKRTKATILLARVHLPIGYGELAGIEQWERDTRRDETEYLVRVAAGLEREHGVAVRTVLLNEPVTTALCKRAHDEHADLILMCTHGHTGFSRAWLGSVADGVARNTAVPVLMLRPRHSQATERIESPEQLLEHAVIPLDGSPVAEAVLDPAMTLATVMDSAVTLLRVVEPVVARSVDYPLPYPLPLGVVDREGTEGAMLTADTYLDKIVQRIRTAHPRLVVSCRVERGDRPAATILDVAKQTNAGLVAMATHGRGMSRLLVGSVADKVLRGSDAAVLLFRPTQE